MVHYKKGNKIMRSRNGSSSGCRLGNNSWESLNVCEFANGVVSQTRNALLKEYGADARLLHLALNEAEALAWQTDFPYLVFPLLAAEKTQAALAWHSRQSAMNSADHTVVLIA